MWDVLNKSLEVRGVNETVASEDSPQLVPLDTFIGLVLAFSSCLFIGISVIVKKLALRDIEARGGIRAVDGGYGYLRLPKWWLGISLMGLGELSNFVAYIFAPAILVTPLGVFSIVCTATLSPYFLKERLGMLGKLGCMLVLVGCVIVTLCGPKDREIASMEELQSQLLYPGFLVYASLVIVVSGLFMALVPRYGHRYVLLYITICSCFGSLSVMFCKGVGLAIKQTIGGINEFTNWATWVCLAALITCLLIETVYMQRALDLFNSSVFMSINYVLFTSLVIVASSILYTELREIGIKNIILTLLGFIVNIVALYLLHLDKEDNSSEASDEGRNEIEAIPQITKESLQAGVQPGTPLLGRTPACPLTGLGLPHTMFPAKTNSCMSLISQTTLHQHTADHNHHIHPNGGDHDNTSQHSNTSQESSSSSRCGSSSADGSSSNGHGDSVRRRDRQNTDKCNRRHCRSSSGCVCEVPLLTELHTSNSKFTVCPPAPQTGISKISSGNNNMRSSSKPGEASVNVEDDDTTEIFKHEHSQALV